MSCFMHTICSVESAAVLLEQGVPGCMHAQVQKMQQLLVLAGAQLDSSP